LVVVDAYAKCEVACVLWLAHIVDTVGPVVIRSLLLC